MRTKVRNLSAEFAQLRALPWPDVAVEQVARSQRLALLQILIDTLLAERRRRPRTSGLPRLDPAKAGTTEPLAAVCPDVPRRSQRSTKAASRRPATPPAPEG